MQCLQIIYSYPKVIIDIPTQQLTTRINKSLIQKNRANNNKLKQVFRYLLQKGTRCIDYAQGQLYYYF